MPGAGAGAAGVVLVLTVGGCSGVIIGDDIGPGGGGGNGVAGFVCVCVGVDVFDGESNGCRNRCVGYCGRFLLLLVLV